MYTLHTVHVHRYFFRAAYNPDNSNLFAHWGRRSSAKHPWSHVDLHLTPSLHPSLPLQPLAMQRNSNRYSIQVGSFQWVIRYTCMY